MLIFSLIFLERFDDPWVKENIGDVISLLCISDEHVLQKVNACFANLGPNLSFVDQILSQNLFFDVLRALPCEWHLATEELVRDDSEAPNVGLEVRRLIQYDFRRLVPKCA